MADGGYNAWQVDAAVAKVPLLRMEIVKRSDDMKGFVVLLTVADEWRAPGDAVPTLNGSCLHRTSKLRCYHKVYATAVDLLGTLIRQMRAEVRPV